VTVLEQRMTKLESGLTPTQAISLFLDRFLSFRTMEAYCRAEQELPGLQQSFVKLMSQMREGARQANPKAKDEVLHRATREMQRDASFLFDLVSGVNEALHAHRRLRCYQLSAVAAELEAPLRELEGVAKRRVVQHERAWPIVVELHAQVLAVSLISARYFGGRDIRVPNLAEDQDLLMEQLGGLLASYQSCIEMVEEGEAVLNRRLVSAGARRARKTRAPVYPPLDEAGAKRLAAQLAELVAAGWIDAAKTSTLLFMGETDQAGAILRRHL